MGVHPGFDVMAVGPKTQVALECFEAIFGAG